MIYDIGGLTPGEQLFSSKGSQSAIISEFNRRHLNLDVASATDPHSAVFLLEVFSERWGNKFYEMRTLAASDGLSSMEMRTQKFQHDQDVLVSLPLFAIMSGISVNEINFAEYNVRVKEEFVTKEALGELHS